MDTHNLMLIDPHIHMTSRTTDDYERMRKAGIVAIIEPAFWLGQPRTEVGSFKDYYSSLVGWERFRASQFGIKHYCTIGLNSKEANNEELAEQVMELLPLFIYKEGVVGVGEIGYDDQTQAEDKYYRLQLELAKGTNMPVQIHTPHRDKKAGTIQSMEVSLEHGLAPDMVIVDHNNEETVKDVLDRGFWAAFTIYPNSKMGNERMVEVVKQYGTERIMINSAADWGISDPLSVPKTAALMLERGISLEDIRKVCYQNALDAFGKSGQMHESDWLTPAAVDQREKFSGSTVLRGGQTPVVGQPDAEEGEFGSNIVR
jgi:predicted metal-dependent TIM-barrel fold hydrolase